MQRAVFAWDGLPSHHERLLLVKIATPAGAATELAGTGHSGLRYPTMLGGLALGASAAVSGYNMGSLAHAHPQSQGLQALEYLNRQGRIRSIQPLAANAPSFDPAGVPDRAMALLTSTGGADASSPARSIESGTSFIEVERNEDVETLRRELSADPSVESVSIVPMRFLCARSATRRAAAIPVGPINWNLERIRLPVARKRRSFTEASEVRVAVLDTGLDLGHPAFAGRKVAYEWFPGASTVSSAEDIVGHGTHVAGTIAARRNMGVEGVCDCDLHAYKIFDDRPVFFANLGYFTYPVNPLLYLRALLACLDAGVEVVNLSIGGPGRPSPQEAQAINALIAADVAVVAAMGNERASGSPTSYPAAIDDVIAVGAVRPDDRVASFSNRGNHIWTCAPGVAVWAPLPTYPGNTGYRAAPAPGGPIQGKPLYRETDYDAWDGTSMAAPHVAGAVALLLANKGPMTLPKIKAALRDSADRVPDMANDFHPDFGYGRLNVDRLLK